ncbi:MAG TPA: hypothetical protein VF960_03930, partial [Chloroflexota bacterium]
LFWLVIGHLAASLNVGYAEMLQYARPLAGACLLGAIWWVVGLYTKVRLQRWVSFLLIALGGGLGWLLILAKPLGGAASFPLDIYVSEANTFLTILAFPFAAATTGLLLLILGLSALAFERESFRLAVLAGLLAMALGLMHGYDLIIIYAVVGVTALYQAASGRHWVKPLSLAFAICALSAPSAAYLTLLTWRSPIWHAVLAQYGNAGVYTPAPAHLLVLIGLPLALLVSVRDGSTIQEKTQPRELLLRCWLVIGFFLLYIPTDFQIKMLGGWQVPVGILATRSLLTNASPVIRRVVALRRWRPELVLGILAVVAVIPVNGYLLGWRLLDLGRHDYPYYLQRDEVAALRWLEASSSPSDVVLSSLTIGQYVPSYTGAHAFLAHWAMTLDYYGKERLVADYFGGASSSDERRAIASRYGVTYVFFGPAERAIGSFDPASAPYLELVFDSPGARVYRVRSPQEGAGTPR